VVQIHLVANIQRRARFMSDRQPDNISIPNISPAELEICLQVLQQISEDPTTIDRHDRFKTLIAKIHKEGRKKSRQAHQQQQQIADRQLQFSTGIVRQQQPQSLPIELGKSRALHRSQNCYICKKSYTELHFFYHLLCPTCAELNYHKRHQRADLQGRIALLTGGRIKIGYQLGLRSLRDGARVLVTTRFPHDCIHRYSQEPDFGQWRERLQIYGLDLRHLPSVEAFTTHLLQTESHLDIIINNAAQTVKRPLAFYQHLLSAEPLPAALQGAIAPGWNRAAYLLEAAPDESNSLPAIASPYFPANTFDLDGQQVDKRPENSWSLKLGEVDTLEMLEVQLVNAVAPFILNGKLKPLLLKSPFDRRFIVNVSAMEGQFNRLNKTSNHPHTNMAKAGLNMLTRTAAADYARDRIYTNSVDTGWITDENPYPKKTNLQTHRGFFTPLDAIDGMARIYDPIVRGIIDREEPLFGHFLKDYAPYPW
jgi:NAD(P)-dependent dehydrogenase (short-subunit alcohol dehydrogenase family)